MIATRDARLPNVLLTEDNNTSHVARPRDRLELAKDARYAHYRKEVLDFLYTPHGHVERHAA